MKRKGENQEKRKISKKKKWIEDNVIMRWNIMSRPSKKTLFDSMLEKMIYSFIASWLIIRGKRFIFTYDTCSLDVCKA